MGSKPLASCVRTKYDFLKNFDDKLVTEEQLQKDPIKNLSNSFDMPKLEMLENFNNERPIPTIDNDLRD